MIKLDLNYCFDKYEENQVVLYGDIFGFSSIMKKINNNKNIKSDFNVNLDNIYNITLFSDSKKWKDEGVNFIWLSDSFAFAGSIDKWKEIKKAFFEFASVLLSSNLIFSGALAIGSLHNEHNIMGYPFVEAVRTQEKMHYPEIIFCQNNTFFDNEFTYIKKKKYYWNYIKELLVINPSLKPIIDDICKNGCNNKKRRISKKYACLRKLVDL